MKKETDMNTDKLETLIALFKNLDSDSLDQVIAALQVELRDRDAVEEAFDDMLYLKGIE